MNITTRTISTLEDLQAIQPQWQELAGDVPMRSWQWAFAWWKHYGDSIQCPGQQNRKALSVLALFSKPDQELVGVVPLFLEQTITKGNVLRLLGTGEVCTDHLSMVVADEDRTEVADAVAKYLTTECDEWDQLELSCVDESDQNWQALTTALQEYNCEVHVRPADACWKIELPGSWDEFLALQSKSHRKQLRRLEKRVLETDRVQWHQVKQESEFEQGWEILVDLHQRRRKSLGEPGCFASLPFTAFHKDVARQLLDCDQLRLSWVDLDGVPIAAEYHFASGTTTFAYQGGLDPDRLDDEPGRLSTILCIQAAINEGHTTFDLLRGDEPYKAHWRAAPATTVDYKIFADRRLAKLRGRVVQTVGTVTDWLKAGIAADMPKGGGV